MIKNLTNAKKSQRQKFNLSIAALPKRSFFIFHKQTKNILSWQKTNDIKLTFATNSLTAEEVDTKLNQITNNVIRWHD